jgi:hypothetical protein
MHRRHLSALALAAMAVGGPTAGNDTTIMAEDERHEEDRARRAIAAQIAADLCGHDLPTIAAIHELLQAVAERPAIIQAIRHAPAGVAAAGRVLAFGGRNLGVVGSAPDRPAIKHARAASRHLGKTLSVVDVNDAPPWPRDTGEGGTGELHITCAAARCLLALERLEGGRG